MWAQTWKNMGRNVRPYPNNPVTNVTRDMVRKKWTPKMMFEKADTFFHSMGLPEMTPDFWKNSVLEKPSDGREFDCQASAWDLFTGSDYRIKQCTRISQENFVTAVHEMAHTHYHMAYKGQSFLDRGPANPGFQEAVAGLFALTAGNYDVGVL